MRLMLLQKAAIFSQSEDRRGNCSYAFIWGAVTTVHCLQNYRQGSDARYTHFDELFAWTFARPDEGSLVSLIVFGRLRWSFVVLEPVMNRYLKFVRSKPRIPWVTLATRPKRSVV